MFLGTCLFTKLDGHLLKPIPNTYCVYIGFFRYVRYQFSDFAVSILRLCTSWMLCLERFNDNSAISRLTVVPSVD